MSSLIHNHRASIPPGRPLRRAGRMIAGIVAAVILSASSVSVRAADVDEALKKATQFLLGLQNEEGAIAEKNPYAKNHRATTSLAILALTAMGHQPADTTPEGQALKRALAYVLRPDGQEPDGYLGAKDGSRMYGHGITTLMLAEMLGMGSDAAQDELIRTKCRKAVELIIRSQKVPKNDNNRGGWRYTPDSGDSDMSVTVWQTMALRAAKNAGMDVPREAIYEAVSYIKRCYEPEKSGKGGDANSNIGSFGYQGRGRELSTTAEGLLALQVCGEYQSEEVLGASNHLLRDGVRPGERWFFYLTYYYAQGMYQRGGAHAEEAKRVVPEVLLPLQARDGSWEGGGAEERQGGKVYATAMAVLSLAVKNHFLPIYQR
ncbi:prenyltransferase/squalene oxidase repeat-containing protein [Verrucomicrobiota bacterium sgz303538]